MAPFVREPPFIFPSLKYLGSGIPPGVQLGTLL